MQIIQKIRDKGAAIVIAVIALSLIGFILMDANLGSSRNAASGNSKLGKINGQTIDNAEFSAKVKQIESQYGGNLSGAQLFQVRQNAWDQIVAEKILGSEFEKLGLVFSPKELTATILSDDAPATLKQAFTDQATGQYDLSKVQQWWQAAKKLKGEQREMVMAQVVEPLQLQSLFQKYNALLAAGGYYPTWLKNKEAAENASFSTISFVNIPYAAISDSTVKVSDDEINAYVAKKKSLYKQDGGRIISYIGFSANPSSVDTVKTYETIAKLKPAFLTDSNTKVFVARNMSTRKFDDIYVPKSKLPAQQKDTLASLGVNNVFGPYLDSKEFVLAKVVGIKVLPDSIKCRHILIGTADRQTGAPTIDTAVAHKRIDSIAAAIASGASFDALEAQYSSDEAAHKEKGVMTFDIATIQNKDNFAVEFGDFLLNEKGETRKTVRTNFGWHYIEILEKKNPAPAYKIAYVSKEILASDETVNAASLQANKLSGENRNIKAFDAYIKKNNLENLKVELPTIVKENDFQVGGLSDARQLVRWAFEAKEGDVSEPFSIGDQYVVAAVKKIQPKGLPDASSARPMVETLVRNEKKAEIIKAKITASATLETAAAAYNVQVQTAGADSSISYGGQIINGVGAEPKVIGAAFNKANQAKASAPIAGNTGVFLVKVLAIGNKANPVQSSDADRARTLSQQLTNGFFESLRNNADIVDERSKIY